MTVLLSSHLALGRSVTPAACPFNWDTGIKASNSSDRREICPCKSPGSMRAASFTFCSPGVGSSHSESTTGGMNSRRGWSCLLEDRSHPRCLPIQRTVHSTRPAVGGRRMTLMSRSKNAGDGTNTWKQQKASDCINEERRNSKSSMK